MGTQFPRRGHRRREFLPQWIGVLCVVLLAGCTGSTGSGAENPSPGLGVDGGGQPAAGTPSGPVSVKLGEAAITPFLTDPQPKVPTTLTDVQGTRVTVTSTDRVLALDLYGSLSRIVFELGLGDRLVGRDTSSAYPEIADRPLVTVNGHNLQAEAILALHPTLIITDTSIGPWDVILQMRDAGIPVVVVDAHRSMDNVGSLTEEVGAALGLREDGRRLGQQIEAEVQAEVSAIKKAAPTRTQDKIRMVFLYVRGQSGIYYLFGEGSGADSLIDALGGYDVAGEIGWQGMKPVNDEGLIAAQPDLILMMTKGLESVGGVDGLLEKVPAVGLTPAGKNRRIVDMPDTEILSFGPRTVDVLAALADGIYGSAAVAGG